MLKIKFYQSGFSLAEFLITLGIIGMVAAMTIPSLISNAESKEFKSAWKKSFSVISNANKSFATNSGDSISGLYSTNSDINGLKLLRGHEEFLNVIKKCAKPGTTTDIDSPVTDCWGAADTSNKKYKDSTTESNKVDLAYVLSDGSHLAMSYSSAGCDPDGTCGNFYVDVNGLKGPNTWGKDVYGGKIFNIKIMPACGKGVQPTLNGCGNDPSADCDTFGAGCSYLFLMP